MARDFTYETTGTATDEDQDSWSANEEEGINHEQAKT